MVVSPSATIDAAIIGARLMAARKARGFTQQHVADALGVARTTLTAMEKGERQPRPAELIRLASLYARQVSDLVSTNPVDAADSFAAPFRAVRVPGGEVESAALFRDIDAFGQLCEDYLRLETIAQTPLARRYPEQYDISGTDPAVAAEELAGSERNRLGIGDGPVGDLWSLLEGDVGLRVFAPGFESRNVTGLYVYTEGFGACCAVNAGDPAEVQRWTLSYIYAHFLTDRLRAAITVAPAYRRVPAAERFAEAFAGQFLMPAGGLIRRFHAIKRSSHDRIAFGDILTLARQYEVSLQAMIVRLEGLRLLPAGSMDRLISSQVAGRENPAKPANVNTSAPQPAVSERYTLLAARAFDNGELSEGELSRYLRTDRVTARERVQDISRAVIYDDGEWEQILIDLSAPLIAKA